MKNILTFLFSIGLSMSVAFAEPTTAVSLMCQMEGILPDGQYGTEVQFQQEKTTISITIPESFIMLEEESNGVPYASQYVFENVETGAQFLIDRWTDDEKNQKNQLRKVYDKENGMILFENICISDYNYLIYTSELNTGTWNFLLLTEEGYRYRFYYCLPVEQEQITIPNEAISILSSLHIFNDGER